MRFISPSFLRNPSFLIPPIRPRSALPISDLRLRLAIGPSPASDLRASSLPAAVASRSFSSGSLSRAAMAVGAIAAEEGSAARRFWIKSQKEAALAAITPFVVCLAAGKLEMETFRQYIAQDVHFLRAYARAYEIAEECTDDDDAKVSIRELRKAVLEELKMHSSFVEEWGIDPTKNIIATPATVKYTDFLLATAEGKVGEKGAGKIVTPFEKTKIAAYTVGAMTPYMRLYSFLGKELQMFLPHDENNHPYRKWINSYSSKSFEAAVVQIEELLDKLSVSLTGEELDIIEKLYHQAMMLEIDFFSTQPVDQPAVVPLTRLHDPMNHLVIFSDFDLTCTVVDSSAILAEIAILKAPKTDPSGTDSSVPRKTSADMRNSWDALSRQYTEEHEQCIESLLPKEEQVFDYECLYKGLAQLSDFEKRANSRVVESGMLSGMNLYDIKRAGELLIPQGGCADFFRKVVKKKKELNADLHILSYCWCADLIRSSFTSVGCLNDLSIHSNEFHYENSISTGEINRKMESPVDKVETFKCILSNCSGDARHLSVYIGDSVGDLLCLLQADVGIVIGSSPSLRKVGKQFGVSFVPLFPGLVSKQKQLIEADPSIWKGLSGVLYTVSSWSEIQAFLLGA